MPAAGETFFGRRRRRYRAERQLASVFYETGNDRQSAIASFTVNRRQAVALTNHHYVWLGRSEISRKRSTTWNEEMVTAERLLAATKHKTNVIASRADEPAAGR